jgi:hypothetical protein
LIIAILLLILISCSLFSAVPQDSGLHVLVLLEHVSQAELLDALI